MTGVGVGLREEDAGDGESEDAPATAPEEVTGAFLCGDADKAGTYGCVANDPSTGAKLPGEVSDASVSVETADGQAYKAPVVLEPVASRWHVTFRVPVAVAAGVARLRVTYYLDGRRVKFGLDGLSGLILVDARPPAGGPDGSAVAPTVTPTANGFLPGHRVLFVTSAPFVFHSLADGVTYDRQDADSVCAEAANTSDLAELHQSGATALLAEVGMGAGSIDTLMPHTYQTTRGRLVSPDGRPLPTLATLLYDEFGADTSLMTRVWTGFESKTSSSGSTCNGWDPVSGGATGSVGVPMNPAAWLVSGELPHYCDGEVTGYGDAVYSYHLYCVTGAPVQ